MAKKKKNKQVQPLMSPEQFIREKARTLPIEVCYMNPEIQNIGEGNIIIVRRHPNNKFTIGVYLVDVFCLGVKDSFYKLRFDELEYEELLERLSFEHLKEVTYEEAHNWIYGAIAFAEEAGISPDKSFNLTKYILEEDTEDIPIIEYDFGKDGEHFLIVNNRLELSRYLPLLQKNLGHGFNYIVNDDEEDDDIDDRLWDSPLFKTYGPDTEYTYQHPEYPMVLSPENKGLVPVLFDPENFNGLSKEQIDTILAMPHDSLRRDLEQIILFRTGQTCDEIPEDEEDDASNPILHALTLLGEVGNENSLDVVLETLRQSSEYTDFHFGDTTGEVYTPVLYKLGKNHLNKLMAFAKEEGLETFSHYQVFPAVAYIAHLHPERREEIIGWFREILRFATEKLPETQYFDSRLSSMIVNELLDLKAIELLPEIKAMFDTGLVDLSVCGDYQQVEEEMLSSEPVHWEQDEYPLDIYKWHEYYRGLWCR